MFVENGPDVQAISVASVGKSASDRALDPYLKLMAILAMAGASWGLVFLLIWAARAALM